MMIRTMAAASLMALLTSAGAHAASDYLLQLDTVKGESRAAPGGGGGGGQIEVQSFSWGASNSGSMASGGMGQGRAAAAPPAGPGSVVVTVAGAASCAKGKHFANAVLTARSSSSYTLEDVTVTECSVHGDPHVMEMSYGKVSVSDLSVMGGPKKGRMAPSSVVAPSSSAPDMSASPPSSQ
jgi:type VI protein secretion system component Hcp